MRIFLIGCIFFLFVLHQNVRTAFMLWKFTTETFPKVTWGPKHYFFNEQPQNWLRHFPTPYGFLLHQQVSFLYSFDLLLCTFVGIASSYDTKNLNYAGFFLFLFFLLVKSHWQIVTVSCESACLHSTQTCSCESSCMLAWKLKNRLLILVPK